MTRRAIAVRETERERHRREAERLANPDPHNWARAIEAAMDPARRPRERSTAELDQRT